jgi:hypothetical protein
MRVCVLLVLGLAVAACGRADYETNQFSAFYVQNEAELLSAIQDEYNKGKFSRLVHFHFEPNDFGGLKSSEVVRSAEGKTRPAVLQWLSALPKEAAAYKIHTAFPAKEVWAQFSYRHASVKRALKAAKALLACEKGRSQHSDFFVLGSGGSHGAWALKEFSNGLKRECGRRINFAILADAISQPGPFPMPRMSGIDQAYTCIHVYQRNPSEILKGQAMENCINVEVKGDVTHWEVADYAWSVTHDLLVRLDSSQGEWALGPPPLYSPLPGYWESVLAQDPDNLFQFLDKDGSSYEFHVRLKVANLLFNRDQRVLSYLEQLNPSERIKTVRMLSSYRFTSGAVNPTSLAREWIYSQDLDWALAGFELVRSVQSHEELRLKLDVLRMVIEQEAYHSYLDYLVTSLQMGFEDLKGLLNLMDQNPHYSKVIMGAFSFSIYSLMDPNRSYRRPEFYRNMFLSFVSSGSEDAVVEFIHRARVHKSTNPFYQDIEDAWHLRRFGRGVGL